jgi:hypothetical protein
MNREKPEEPPELILNIAQVNQLLEHSWKQSVHVVQSYNTEGEHPMDLLRGLARTEIHVIPDSLRRNDDNYEGYQTNWTLHPHVESAEQRRARIQEVWQHQTEESRARNQAKRRRRQKKR